MRTSIIITIKPPLDIVRKISLVVVKNLLPFLNFLLMMLEFSLRDVEWVFIMIHQNLKSLGIEPLLFLLFSGIDLELTAGKSLLRDI